MAPIGMGNSKGKVGAYARLREASGLISISLAFELVWG